LPQHARQDLPVGRGLEKTGRAQVARRNAAGRAFGITRCRRSRSSVSDCGAPPAKGSSTSMPPRRRRRTQEVPGEGHTFERQSDAPAELHVEDRKADRGAGFASITSFR